MYGNRYGRVRNNYANVLGKWTPTYAKVLGNGHTLTQRYVNVRKPSNLAYIPVLFTYVPVLFAYVPANVS